MKTIDEKDATLVPLDPATDEWLERLSRVTGDPKGEIVASMLRMIRLDDQKADPEGGETRH